MQYYYDKAGQVQGPVSLDDLKGLYQRGEITMDTQVCLLGSDTWVVLSSLGQVGQPTSVQSTTQSLSSPSARYEYKVVPFVAVIAHGKGADAAASQLQQVIQSLARGGWEYVRLESVETYIQGDNGCFGLQTTPPRSTVYSMAVFRK